MDSVMLVISFILLEIFENSVNGDLPLSDYQTDRLCSSINNMKQMQQSDAKIENYIRQELDRSIEAQFNSIPEVKSSDKTKSYQYNYGGKIDIKSNAKIGKGGQLSDLKMIGTDTSSGTHAFPLFLQQVNNDVQQGELSDSIVLSDPVISLRRQTRETDDQIDSQQYTLMSNIERSHRKVDDCLRMIETIYKRIVHKIRSNKFVHMSDSPEMIDKASEFVEKNSENNYGENSTSINTQMNLGSDGFISSISHIARGNSTSINTNSEAEGQAHGRYKDSKISLMTLIVSGFVS